MSVNSIIKDVEQDCVTVVIPTYNRAKLLIRAVASIQQQTHTNWKLIIIDNASSDNTSEVVAELASADNRISYHRHSENIGMLPNWEFAVSVVKTNYFGVLCDDDYVLPNFLAGAMREMTLHPEIGLCFGIAVVVDEAGNRLGEAPNQMTPGYYEVGHGASAMLKLQHPATPAVIFRTECIKAVGGFDKRSLYVADLDMLVRVALKYPIKFFNEEVACYVVHAGNSFKDITGWHPGLLNVIKNIKNLEIDDKSHQRKIFNSFRNHAIQPLLASFIAHPIKNYKPIVLMSAIQCLIETGQLFLGMSTLFGNLFTLLASKTKWTLISVASKTKWTLISVASKTKWTLISAASKIKFILVSIFKATPLALYFSWSDTKARYRRSVLGPYWLVIGTAIGVAGLGLLWGALLKVDRAIFVPSLATGLVIWQLLAGCITESATTFTRNAPVIRNLNTPFLIFPLQLLFKHLINFAHNLSVVALVLIIFPPQMGFMQLLFVPGLLIVVGNLLWVAILIGMLGARFRDLEQVIVALIPIIFFLSPVIYRPDQLGIREQFVWLNPFSYMISLIRDPLLGSVPPYFVYFVSIGLLLIGWLVTLLFWVRKRNRIVYWV
jgi:ABC-type polysaccharide/polyol phosphate export permease/GT2 family glycosyltransferase